MLRGWLHTTTVRFDADTWAVIVAESERLGIAPAEYIRGAVLRHAGRAVDADLGRRLEAVEEKAEELAARVAVVARGCGAASLRRERRRAADATDDRALNRASAMRRGSAPRAAPVYRRR